MLSRNKILAAHAIYC